MSTLTTFFLELYCNISISKKEVQRNHVYGEQCKSEERGMKRRLLLEKIKEWRLRKKAKEKCKWWRCNIKVEEEVVTSFLMRATMWTSLIESQLVVLNSPESPQPTPPLKDIFNHWHAFIVWKNYVGLCHIKRVFSCVNHI